MAECKSNEERGYLNKVFDWAQPKTTTPGPDLKKSDLPSREPFESGVKS